MNNLCIIFKNLVEMDTFLEKYKLPKLFQETENIYQLSIAVQQMTLPLYSLKQ